MAGARPMKRQKSLINNQRLYTIAMLRISLIILLIVSGNSFAEETKNGVANAIQIQGKDLSYNNINDTDAAFDAGVPLEASAASRDLI